MSRVGKAFEWLCMVILAVVCFPVLVYIMYRELKDEEKFNLYEKGERNDRKT